MAIFPSITKIFNGEDAKLEDLSQASFQIFFIFLGFSLVVAFASNFLVEAFFDSSYKNAVVPMQVLILSAPFSYGSIPFLKYLEATGKEIYSMLIHGFTALINIPLNFILFINFGILGIAFSTFIISFFKPLISFLVCRIYFEAANENSSY